MFLLSYFSDDETASQHYQSTVSRMMMHTFRIISYSTSQSPTVQLICLPRPKNRDPTNKHNQVIGAPNVPTPLISLNKLISALGGWQHAGQSKQPWP